MSIKHKCQLVVIGILSILLMSFSLIGIIQLDVKAEENQYFTCNQYTETDYLLMADGSDSSKNIQTFATEVKSASIGTEFPELSQVIPLQYLESIEENAAELLKGQPYRSIHQNWVLTYSNSHSMID